MELRALRYFAVIVETGSLTAAAARLHLSQPSLSVAVTRLEAEVGVQLLMRSTRGVAPTPAGRYLLDASSHILGSVDEMVSTLQRFGAGLEGAISIAAVPVLMWARIPQLLRSFAADAPGVETQLFDPPPWGAIDMLEARRVDVAAILVSDPARFAQRHGADFDIVDWGEVPLVGVLPAGAADAPDPLPLEAFSRATLVLPQRTSALASLPEAVEEALARVRVVPREWRTAATIQSGMPLIEAGLAWGILPDPGRSSLGRFDVRVCSLSPEPPPLRALALVRKGDGERPVVARLLRQLLDLDRD